MPIYEFKCCSCGEKFEAYCGLSGQAEEIKCPRCGKPELERIFSTFSTKSKGSLPAANKSCSRFS
jgi:putative FmdB family regulatory protein